jgi:(p)ppGpp synthase/HD superfamily hydrolase
MNELEIARQIAGKAHSGQKDKSDADYILHPLKVSEYCKTNRGKIAALLHDVVEDSDITLGDLKKGGIGEDVVLAVDCLTKREGEPLGDYYRRVASNDLAVEVKFADMRHNSDAGRWSEDRREEALKNFQKYLGRARMLFDLVGATRAKSLMTAETLDWLENG